MSSSSPINPAVDQLADLALWEAELASDPQVMASSLTGRLEQVPDPRDPRGCQHPLVVVLVLTACATLAVGNDSLTAIWQWAAGTGQQVLARIGARFDGWTGRYLVPSEATFRRVLTLIDGDSLDAAISGYIADVLAGTAAAPMLPAMAGPVEREQRRAVTRQQTHPAPAGLLPGAAADGNLLHGSVTADARTFLVAAIDHTTGMALGQQQVADKRGEGTTIEPLLSGLPAGIVWTLDALHTSKKTARLITGPLRGHYILFLKANQPLALQAAQALLSGTDIEFAEQTHQDLDHPSSLLAEFYLLPCRPNREVDLEHLFVVNNDQAKRATPTTLPECSLEERKHLQEWVIANPDVLGEEVLVITSEYDQWAADIDGKPESDRLDVLGIDSTGQLVVAELKRENSGRNVHLQAITYAALVSGFNLDTLAEAYVEFWSKRREGVDLEAAQKAISSHVGGVPSPAVLRRPRMVLISRQFPKQVTNSAVWLSEMGLDIRLVQISIWRIDDDLTVAGFTKLYPTPQVEEFTLAPARREAKAVAEDLQEGKRSGRTATRIVNAGVLPSGSRLKMKPGHGASAVVRARIASWLEGDESRALATWVNDKSRPLKWASDGIRYTPSKLAQTVYEAVENSKAPAVQGPAWWIFDPDESQEECPEALRAFIGLNLVEIANLLPSDPSTDLEE